MEENNFEESLSNGNTPNSRWTPTKEQISMLEGLYKQGIRTPSAEQIQQITSRLKVYGHIEGKNVFYWFQNHKARQRQKQKQDSMAYFNHFIQNRSPVFAPHCNNVVCSPYYHPPKGLGYYPQYPKVPIPSDVSRIPRVHELENTNSFGGGGYQRYNVMINRREVNTEMINKASNSNETLALFPLHPTSISEDSSGSYFPSSSSAENSNPSCSSESVTEERSGDQQFFDFFAQH